MDTKLTHKSQDALSTAVQRAAADGSPQVEPLHLLLALVEQADGTTAPLLRAVGADPALIAKQAEERLARLPRARGATLSAPELSRPLLSAISTAEKRAKDLGDEYISTEHLLVGLAADGAEQRGGGAVRLLGERQEQVQRLNLWAAVRRGALNRGGQRVLALVGELGVHFYLSPLGCPAPLDGPVIGSQTATRAPRTGTSPDGVSWPERRSSASRAATARVDSSSTRS